MGSAAAIEHAKQLMDKAIVHLEAELLKIRTGKANPAMVDSVMVEYYGSMVPLSQIANVTTPDARTLVIQPWEKNKLQDVERSIINSNLGLNPQNDGEIIRISVPPLTEERRREMVKIAKNQGEDSKVSIRNARRDANEMVKKAQKEGLPEDVAKDTENIIQNLTNEYISKIDAHVARKEKEILTV
jgi:ribosome recycling factor